MSRSKTHGTKTTLKAHGVEVARRFLTTVRGGVVPRDVNTEVHDTRSFSFRSDGFVLLLEDSFDYGPTFGGKSARTKRKAPRAVPVPGFDSRFVWTCSEQLAFAAELSAQGWGRAEFLWDRDGERRPAF